jgi:predicted transcriptional regulator
MEININVSDKGINYELSSKKPFNEDNWNKAIKRMIEEKEITKEEAKIFNKMIETLLHYA